MAGRKSKLTHAGELKQLEASLQTRIKRTYWIAGVWGGLVLLGGLTLALSKPYLTKKRLERMQQPGYKPYAVPKKSGYAQLLKEEKKGDQKDK